MDAWAEVAGGQWDELYAEADGTFFPSHPVDHVVRFVARRIRPMTAAGLTPRVLDVGSGGGRHTHLVAGEGAQAVGLDFSHASLLKARRRSLTKMNDSPSPAWVRASYASLPFSSNRFDSVVCFAVLCYGHPDEISQGVSEIHRVLRPGGWAFLWFRSIDDCRFGRGREVAPNTFQLDSDFTSEKGMPVCFFDASGIDRLTRDFADRFVGSSKMHYAPGRIDSDWLVEVKKGGTT